MHRLRRSCTRLWAIQTFEADRKTISYICMTNRNINSIFESKKSESSHLLRIQDWVESKNQRHVQYSSRNNFKKFNACHEMTFLSDMNTWKYIYEYLVYVMQHDIKLCANDKWSFRILLYNVTRSTIKNLSSAKLCVYNYDFSSICHLHKLSGT